MCLVTFVQHPDCFTYARELAICHHCHLSERSGPVKMPFIPGERTDVDQEDWNGNSPYDS